MSKDFKHFFNNQEQDQTLSFVEESFTTGDLILAEYERSCGSLETLTPVLESLTDLLALATNDAVDIVLNKEVKKQVSMESLGLVDIPLKNVSGELKHRLETSARKSIETIITGELGMSLEDYHFIVMESKGDDKKSIIAVIWEKLKSWARKAFEGFLKFIRKAFNFTIAKLRKFKNKLEEYSRVSFYRSNFPGKEYTFSAKHNVLAFLSPSAADRFDSSGSFDFTTFLEAVKALGKGIETIDDLIGKIHGKVREEILLTGELVKGVFDSKDYEAALRVYGKYASDLNNLYQKGFPSLFNKPVSEQVKEAIGHDVTHSITRAYAQDNTQGAHVGPYITLNKNTDASEFISQAVEGDLKAFEQIPRLFRDSYKLLFFNGRSGKGVGTFIITGMSEKFHDDAIDYIKALSVAQGAFFKIARNTSEVFINIPDVTSKLTGSANVENIRWELDSKGKALVESVIAITKVTARNALAFIANGTSNIVPEIEKSISSLDSSLDAMVKIGSLSGS